MSTPHPTANDLERWLPAQRWFTSSTTEPRLRVLATQELTSADPDARVEVVIVVDEAPARPIVYHVPIVSRSSATTAPAGAVIGTGDDGRVWIDGPWDPAYTDALLSALGLSTDGVRADVLTGEQSNTSIVFRWPSAPPVICKVFRQLSAGINPDIELQSALTAGGSTHVPRVVGAVSGSWPSADDARDGQEGSLAFAQEFFPDVEDAWRVALRAAAAGADFTSEAHALGRTTAEVHHDLARLLPTAVADESAREAIVRAWRRRLAIAADEVPELRGAERRIEAVYTAAADGSWPALQRVHGDYHLGQVLSAGDRGWVLLDFEGEPMRPIAERRTPDLALRDVAGMLRSFDYVAGSLTGESADAWAQAARAAFLEGYRTSAGVEPAGAVLRALELDKAVYEAIYEARHRPTWLRIPLDAIGRLLAD